MTGLRTLLLLVLAFAVPAQSFAGIAGCVCDAHGDSHAQAKSSDQGYAHPMSMADHTEPHDSSPDYDPHAERAADHDCNLEAADCGCDACVSFVGLPELGLPGQILAVGQDSLSVNRLAEPFFAPALRPPISA